MFGMTYEQSCRYHAQKYLELGIRYTNLLYDRQLEAMADGVPKASVAIVAGERSIELSEDELEYIATALDERRKQLLKDAECTVDP